MPFSRRAFLQVAAAVTTPAAARAALPDADWTRAAHSRLAQAPRLLAAASRATVAAIADAIIPRTDTPGALDVDTVEFIELLLAEWASDEDRTMVERGLVELEERAYTEHGRNWPALGAATAASEIAWAEARTEQPTTGQRALRRIKSWTLHAWITSETVQKTVIRTNITPGKYEGCVPRPSTGGTR